MGSYRLSRIMTTDGHLYVAVAGEIDLARHQHLRAQLMGPLASRPLKGIIVDMHEVSFLDASGVHTLVDCWKAAQEAGCRLRVVNPQGIVRQVLELTGTLQRLAGENALD